MGMENFNLKAFLDVAEEFARSDETIKALDILENMPGEFRDNMPMATLELKREILSRIQTTYDLVTSAAYDNTHEKKMEMKQALRGLLIIKEIKFFNEKGLVPYLIDFGPGDYWVPEVLLDEGCRFNYEPICINSATRAKRNQYPRIPGDGPKIFFACEVIEHLWDTRELVAQSLKGGLPDIIHISTPKYTFNPFVKNFRDIGELGHLRTFTPSEFYKFMATNYPDFFIGMYDNIILHARLVNQNSKCEVTQQTKSIDPFGIKEYMKGLK